MSWTSTSIIHIAKFRRWTLFVGKHIIYNRRVPFCSMMTSRKTSFVSATWKSFLVITSLSLLTCLYMLQVILFLRSICFCVFYKRIKIPSIWNLPWCFFFSKEKLKDTCIVWVKYFPCIYLAFHINSSYFLKIVCWDDVFLIICTVLLWERAIDTIDVQTRRKGFSSVSFPLRHFQTTGARKRSDKMGRRHLELWTSIWQSL